MYYKLKASACAGKGNKVLLKKHDDVYTEEDFEEGDAQKKVEQGFLIECDKNGKPLNAEEEETHRS